jgi:hypothetical protein
MAVEREAERSPDHARRLPKARSVSIHDRCKPRMIPDGSNRRAFCARLAARIGFGVNGEGEGRVCRECAVFRHRFRSRRGRTRIRADRLGTRRSDCAEGSRTPRGRKSGGGLPGRRAALPRGIDHARTSRMSCGAASTRRRRRPKRHGRRASVGSVHRGGVGDQRQRAGSQTCKGSTRPGRRA